MPEDVDVGLVEGCLHSLLSLEQFEAETRDRFAQLSERETQILALVAAGRDNPAIAKRLGIRRTTVQNHRANIRQKLHITDDSDYLRYALAFDLVTWDAEP